MRPTIPLAEWRIATDPGATRALHGVVPTPECGRLCGWCRNWMVAYREALSAPLAQQLERLGIDPTHPTDLHAFAEPEDPSSPLIPTRVTFHVVGRILSGPTLWTQHPSLGRVRNYVNPSEGPPGVGLSVAAAAEVYDAPPWHDVAEGPLLQVDFRLPVPWLLQEARPEIGASSGPRAV